MATHKVGESRLPSHRSLIFAVLLLAAGIMGFSGVLAQSGDLYISNFTFPNPVVLRYDGQSGDFVEVFASGGGLVTAAGLDFGPNGNLFVASQSCCINEYDGVTGAFIRRFVSGINTRGLVFGPDGNLYAADASGNKIERYNGETGAYIDDFIAEGSGGLDFPQHLAFGPDGNLYVSGTRTTAVLRYNGVTGDFLGQAAPVGGPQHGIAFGSDGLLYVATPLTGEVQRFDGATGTFVDIVLNVRDVTDVDVYYSVAIVFGPGGDLYVSASDDPLETTPGFVLRYDGQTYDYLGVFAEGGIQGGGLNNPYSMIFDVGAAPIFSCVGFEPPMDVYPVTVKGKNRALPLKAQLFDADDYLVTDTDITAAPVLQVLYDSGTGGERVDVTDDALPAGQGTEGNQFEFTDDKWQYNLKTKNYTAEGTYTISIVSGDATEYVIDPTCVTSFVRD